MACKRPLPVRIPLLLATSSILIKRRWRWSPERYVALKIKAHNRKGGIEADNELQISKIISKNHSSHHGRFFVRNLLDHFILEGPFHRHMCLVFEPLREPLWITKSRFNKNTFPPEILKIVIQMLLQGLDYLHTCCNVVHTGTAVHV